MNFAASYGTMDVTLRDAGYLNNWNFTEQESYDIISGLAQVSVDAIEIGYLSDNETRSIIARCPPAFISQVRAQIGTQQLVAMISLAEMKPEVILRSRQGLLDLIRIPATYGEIKKGLAVAKIAKKFGFHCSLNLLNISALTLDELKDAILRCTQSSVIDVLYLADSRGACTQVDIFECVSLTRQMWNGLLGFHGHNNSGLATANSEVALEAGCNLIDATINGFGLGGGNTRLDHALAMVENKSGTTRYHYEILDRLSQSVFILMPAKTSYLYYLSGQKNLAQLWVEPLLKRYGRKTSAYLQKIPKKPYQHLDEVIAEMTLNHSEKKCLVLNNREPYPEDLLEDLNHQAIVAWYQKSADEFSLAEAFEKYKDTQILITTYMNLNQHNLGLLPALEAIIATTISTHFIDSAYCQQHAIKIFNTPDYTGSSVAEFAIALMMAANRRLPELAKIAQSGKTHCFDIIGSELYGKQVGIVGFGNIGSRIAELTKAFGMDVIFYNRSLRKSPIARQVNLNTLITDADFIFTTLPLNKDSKGIIGKKEFFSMKPSAIFINTSPDEIFDRRALRDALINNSIAYAAVDLLDPTPLLQTPNLLMTSRRGWYTRESFHRRMQMWKQRLSDYLAGKPMNSKVTDFVQI